MHREVNLTGASANQVKEKSMGINYSFRFPFSCAIFNVSLVRYIQSVFLLNIKALSCRSSPSTLHSAYVSNLVSTFGTYQHFKMLAAEKQANDLNTIRQRKEIADGRSSLDLNQNLDQKDTFKCHTKEEFSDSTRVSSITSQQNDISTGQEKCTPDGYGTAYIEAAQRIYSRSIPPKRTEETNIVDWDGPDDPENPMNWPSLKRWTHIMLVSAANFLTGIASSMFAPGVPALMEEFKSTNSSLASFVVTIFVLGLATGPIVFAPLSEIYGRLYIQHTGLVGFLVFTIACGVSSNLNMLIGFRLMQGIFGSVPLTNAGGVIADMVRQEVRGFAMAMFTLGVLLGPVIGPVSGGFLSAAKGVSNFAEIYPFSHT